MYPDCALVGARAVLLAARHKTTGDMEKLVPLGRHFGTGSAGGNLHDTVG